MASRLASSADLYNISDLNSWWGVANKSSLDYARRGSVFSDFEPVSYGAAIAPGDWSEFRKEFGNGYATQNDYNNWQRQKVRENSLAAFVDRMSKGDSSLNDYRAQMNADYGQFKDKLLGWADTDPNQTNRFEGGLSRNEARLNALLDAPDSIKQSASYNFRLKQGEDALQRQLGAKGLLRSGNRLQALMQYGQDMASQEYEAQAKRLSDLVGMYGGNWVADKNANTQAWATKGKTLSDMFGQAATNYNASQKLGADQRLGWANAWTAQAPKAFIAEDIPANSLYRWG